MASIGDGGARMSRPGGLGGFPSPTIRGCTIAPAGPEPRAGSDRATSRHRSRIRRSMAEFLFDVIPRGKKLTSVEIQPDLFRADATPPEGAPPRLLIPVPTEAQSRLTKPQQTFNRLVRQIESLRRDIERATVDWNGWLEVNARHIHPLEVRICASRKAMLRLLIPFLEKGQKLRPRQRETLKELVVGEFETILDTEPDLRDEDLQRVYDDLTQSDAPEPEDDRFEAMRQGMEDFMQKAGVDVDLSELDPVHHARTGRCHAPRRREAVALHQCPEGTGREPERQPPFRRPSSALQPAPSIPLPVRSPPAVPGCPNPEPASRDPPIRRIVPHPPARPQCPRRVAGHSPRLRTQMVTLRGRTARRCEPRPRCETFRARRRATVALQGCLPAPGRIGRLRIPGSPPTRNRRNP